MTMSNRIRLLIGGTILTILLAGYGAAHCMTQVLQREVVNR